MLRGLTLRSFSAGLTASQSNHLYLILIQSATAALCKRQMKSAAAISPGLSPHPTHYEYMRKVSAIRIFTCWWVIQSGVKRCKQRKTWWPQHNSSKSSSQDKTSTYDFTDLFVSFLKNKKRFLCSVVMRSGEKTVDFFHCPQIRVYFQNWTCFIVLLESSALIFLSFCFYMPHTSLLTFLSSITG